MPASGRVAPRTGIVAEYGAHLLTRLQRHAAVPHDAGLLAPHEERRSYPGVEEGHSDDPAALLFVPLRLHALGADPTFFSTIATFGTALDVTLAELAIESFFPADRSTEAALRANL